MKSSATDSRLNRPREVIYGPGASGGVAAALGNANVAPGTALMVADAAVAGLGLTQHAVDSLDTAGWTVEIFDAVVAEPQVAVAREVLSAIEGAGATAVIGIGGGSALDLAKIGAAVAVDGVDLDAALAGEVALISSLPSIAIPTTSGTGAECTEVAPIADGQVKLLLRGPGLMPDIAVLDAELTVNLPAAITAATGIDALAHACEAFTSTNATYLTDCYALDAARAITTSLIPCCGDDPSLAEREQLLFGAHLAGTALNAGVVVGHSAAYSLAGRTHLPHGVTTGVVLPYFLLYNRPAIEERLQTLGQVVTGSASGDRFIDWIVATSAAVGLPASLRDTGLERHQLEGMATEIVERYPRPNNPLPLEPERLLRFLEFAWEGDLEAAKAGVPAGSGHA